MPLSLRCKYHGKNWNTLCKGIITHQNPPKSHRWHPHHHHHHYRHHPLWFSQRSAASAVPVAVPRWAPSPAGTLCCGNSAASALPPPPSWAWPGTGGLGHKPEAAHKHKRQGGDNPGHSRIVVVVAQDKGQEHSTVAGEHQEGTQNTTNTAKQLIKYLSMNSHIFCADICVNIFTDSYMSHLSAANSAI